MEQRTIVTPWRHLGSCLAVLSCLAVAQPAMAGEFFLDAEGTPELTVSLDANKPFAAPEETVEFRLLVRNVGTAPATNTRAKLTWLAHAEYLPDSTTRDGAPYPDDFDGNPFLRGVYLGDVEPGVDVVVTFKVIAKDMVAGECPMKIQAVVENDLTPPVQPPLHYTPIYKGQPNIQFEKLGDVAFASPGQTITYRLVVRNTGNGNALDVTVKDTIPAWTFYVPGSTTVNGEPVADEIGGTPLQAGIHVGDMPMGGPPVIISMTVRINQTTPPSVMIKNTALWGENGMPNHPSNTVDTPLIDHPLTPEPEGPKVPNLITMVPDTTGRGLVTGTPTDITVCPTDCAPTTALIHVSADASRGPANTWLQVVGMSGTGGASIQTSLGPSLPERLGREGLLAPGSDTVFEATFPEPGGTVDIVLSLTPKALQLVTLDQIMQKIAIEAGIAPPTPLQVLSMYSKASSIPTLKTMLSVYGPMPAPPPVPVATDAPFTLLPTSPDQLDQLTFEFQTSSQTLTNLLYLTGDMDALRDALTTVLKAPINNAQIRPVVLRFAEDTPEKEQLLNELSLVLNTRNHPEKLSFQALYRP
jgi:uncharacterized repeat protein (TIGR01451 family)